MDRVSREQAFDIAAQRLIDQPNRKIHVWAFGEVGCPHPRLYGFSEARLRDCWVVSVSPETPHLQSSEVVIISKATGEILYSGSANDEG